MSPLLELHDHPIEQERPYSYLVIGLQDEVPFDLKAFCQFAMEIGRKFEGVERFRDIKLYELHFAVVNGKDMLVFPPQDETGTAISVEDAVEAYTKDGPAEVTAFGSISVIRRLNRRLDRYISGITTYADWERGGEKSCAYVRKVLLPLLGEGSFEFRDHPATSAVFLSES
jgi:hypothetical protein